MTKMVKDIRKIAYERYVSKHFTSFHNLDMIRIEYEKTYLWVKEHLLRFINHLKKHSKILDIGCGLGHHIYAFKKLGFSNVLGVDISPECVEFCKQQGFNVVQADIFDFLSDCEEKFDLIIAFDFIEHLTVEEGYLLAKLILRCLNPTGLFIMNVPNANNILKLRERYIDITHKTIYTPESIKELLLLAGFKRVIVIGVKPFSTMDTNIYRKLFKKMIALPIYRISLLILKLLYHSTGMFDVTILDPKMLVVGEK